MAKLMDDRGMTPTGYRRHYKRTGLGLGFNADNYTMDSEQVIQRQSAAPAPAAAGGMGAPAPSPTGASGIADLLYGKASAQLGNQFGASGMRSSSMLGEALGTASAEAQLAGYQYEQQARAQSFNEWRGRQEVGMQKEQLKLQKKQINQAWDMYTGTLDLQRYFQMAQGMERNAPSPALPRGYGGGGGGGQMAGQARLGGGGGPANPTQPRSLSDTPMEGGYAAPNTGEYEMSRWQDAEAAYKADPSPGKKQWADYWFNKYNKLKYG